MGNLLEDPIKHTFSLLGKNITLNMDMLVMTWLVIAISIVLAFVATRKMKKVPGKLQSAFEMFVEAFEDLVVGTLGEEGRGYIPLIATIFLFVLLSNWIGVVPHLIRFIGMIFALLHKMFGGTVEVTTGGLWAFIGGKVTVIPPSDAWYSFLFKLPGFSEPTRYLSTDIALGLISAAVVHYSAIREKGILAYLKSYCEPIWIFLPINVIGELAKVVSHSFRLFGNILGGSIIFIIVSKLVLYIGIPVGLSLFFGLFVGAIQAFVFAMLAVTYIAVMTK